MTARGLKTKITLNVAFLLLISAFVTDVLVVMVLQSVWARKHIENESVVLNNISRYLLSPSFTKEAENALSEKQTTLNLLMRGRRLNVLIITNTKRDIRFQSHSPLFDAALLKQAVLDTLNSEKEKLRYLNYNWAVFWWHPFDVLVSSPIQQNGQVIGAVAAVISLKPIYLAIRQYNKPILFYILMNTGILTLIGLYRMFRIYLRPIDRIVSQADEYREDDDLLFTFRREDNELNRLSMALNRMLQRISSDKKRLRESYLSLEKAYGELREAQNEIIKAEKMASIGRLASGLAHEIGNPIGIVMGYLDLLKDASLTSDEKADFLARAQKETQRMDVIIHQLLNLARPKESKNSPISVHSIIQDVVDIMRHQPVMRKNHIEVKFDATLDTVWANGEQLHQVFLNILINAADAIQSSSSNDKGRILIHTYNQNSDVPNCDASLCVQMEDNGEGIPDDEIGYIFDPFYTTKEPGKGTGLGLAVSYMIIKNLGGSLSAESKPGQGTSMNLQLPVRSPSDV